MRHGGRYELLRCAMPHWLGERLQVGNMDRAVEILMGDDAVEPGTLLLCDCNLGRLRAGAHSAYCYVGLAGYGPEVVAITVPPARIPEDHATSESVEGHRGA